MSTRAPAAPAKRAAPPKKIVLPAELREELRLRVDESLEEQSAGTLIDAEEHLARLDTKPRHRRAG